MPVPQTTRLAASAQARADASPRTTSLVRTGLLMSIAVLLVSCRPAAALDAAGRCIRDKMRVSRVVAAKEILCAGDDACLARIMGRAEHRLAFADARAKREGYACPGSGESLALTGAVPWPVRFLEAYAGSGRDRCNAAHLRAASRFTSAYSRCVADNVIGQQKLRDFHEVEQEPAHGLVQKLEHEFEHEFEEDLEREFEECSRRANAVFTAAWSSAQSASACPGATPLASMSKIIEEIEETASRLEVRCGDGRVAGFEQCDDGGRLNNDGCSSNCRTETCGRAGGTVRCVVCPDDSIPNESYDGCRCDDGFSGEPGSCVDIDECAVAEGPCPVERPCVNLEGTYACAIACTADAFHQALASCGAPNGAIAFHCTDTVIPIPGGLPVYLRENDCDDLTIDGAGRNITFELAPTCWQTPLPAELCPGGLEIDGTCQCPNVDSGDTFLQVRGDRNVVRDLTVRGFFDGIPVRGRSNVVENVRFDRQCDDAFGSVVSGVGNVFRHLVVRNGCDKCSENGASLEFADPDPRVLEHFSAKMTGIEFDGCRTPIRIASSGRFAFDNLWMHADDPQFPCDGPRFSSSGDGAHLAIQLRDSTVEGCRRGVRFGSGSQGWIRDTRIAGSRLRGLLASGNARVSVEHTTITGNGGSGSSEPGFGGVAILGQAEVDLGGGSLMIDKSQRQSAGENTICGNRSPGGVPLELQTDFSEPVYAMRNWWCSTESPAGRIAAWAIVDPVLDRAPPAIRP